MKTHISLSWSFLTALLLTMFLSSLALTPRAWADDDAVHRRSSEELGHERESDETASPRKDSHRANHPSDLVHRTQDARDWSEFDRAMLDLRTEEHRTGVSYVISGSLVTIGAMIAPFSTNDTATKFVYGIVQGVGVAAIGYGIAKLYYSSEYDSFYESLKNSTIRDDQKSALVQSYLQRERDRRDLLRKINFYSHLGLGALNVYSAIAEKDKSTKVFMGFLAGINFALAFTYEF